MYIGFIIITNVPIKGCLGQRRMPVGSTFTHLILWYKTILDNNEKKIFMTIIFTTSRDMDDPTLVLPEKG